VIELIFHKEGKTPSLSDLLNNKKTGKAIESDKLERKYPEIPSGPGELDLYKERKPSETSSSEIVQCDGRILSNFLIQEVKLEMSDGGITDERSMTRKSQQYPYHYLQFCH